MARDDEDDGTPASPTAVALVELAALMHKVGSADHADVTAFIAAHAHLPKFPERAKKSQALWHLHLVCSLSPTPPSEEALRAGLADELRTLGELMEQYQSADHEEVIRFVTEDSAYPGFKDLAEAARAEWRQRHSQP